MNADHFFFIALSYGISAVAVLGMVAAIALDYRRLKKSLQAMGVKPEISEGAIRVSLGWASTEQDIDHFIAAWRKIRDRHKARAAA